jgi:SAM-dependent methyltransferase
MSSPSVRGREMQRFWDERAREDALFFVDNRLDYGDPDMESFWAGGEQGVAATLEATGMEVAPADAIVEIGCGVGRLTRALAARGREVWAIEVSPEMLELARGYNEQLTNVHWTLGDGESLEGIADGSVDGCFSLVVFQHIPDPQVILGYVREFGRVLRPGGWAAFQVSNDPSVHNPSRFVRARAAAASLVRRGPRGQTDPAWLGTAIDLDELTETAEAAGLKIEKVAGAGTQYCLVGARRAA